MDIMGLKNGTSEEALVSCLGGLGAPTGAASLARAQRNITGFHTVNRKKKSPISGGSGPVDRAPRLKLLGFRV